MNLPNETIVWGIGVVTYETLAALAAGVAIIAYLLTLLKPDELKTDISRSWHITWITMSGILLSVPVILGLHLEQPLRSVTILFRGNPTSPMSYGVLILISWIVVALYGLLGIKQGSLTPGRRKAISLIGSVLGILFVAYLGFLLSVMKGMNLWYSALKPVQYIIGTFGVGAAVVLLAHQLFDSHEAGITTRLRGWLISGLIANAVVKAVGALNVVYIGKASLSAAGLSFSVYGLEWILGFIVPLAVIWFTKNLWQSKFALYLATVGTLMGIFAEKFNLVIGGQLISRVGGLLPKEAQHIWGTEAWQAVGGLALAVFFLLLISIVVPLRAKQEPSYYSASKNLKQ